MPLNTDSEVRALGNLAPSVVVAPFLGVAARTVATRLAGAYPPSELKDIEAYYALHLQYLARSAASANGAAAGGGAVTSRSIGGASESYAAAAGLKGGLESSPWGVLLRTLDYKQLLAPAGYASAEWLGDDCEAEAYFGRYPRGVY